MLYDERYRLYSRHEDGQRPPRFTSARYRRLKHKYLSRKAHAHYRGQTCPWCRPAAQYRQEQQA